jgi:hypothetical protein
VAKGETAHVSSNPSPLSTLQNRRERVEELNLEAQELRAQGQLDALRREQEQEQAECRSAAEMLRQERRDQAHAKLIERQRAAQQEREERERRRAAQEEQA